MEFRKKRKRHFSNIFIRIALHLLVSLMAAGCAYWALVESSWYPVIGILAAILVLEGAYWFDVVYGWPMSGRQNERESN